MNSSNHKSDHLLRFATLTCFVVAAVFGFRALEPGVPDVLPAAAADVSADNDVTLPLAPEAFDAPTASQSQFHTRNIEDIQPGDMVLARDEHGTEIGWKPVKEVYRRTSDHLRHLTFEAEDGTQQTLSTTDEHPFWSVTAHEFLEAGSLPVGDQVTDQHGNKQTLVGSIREEFPDGIAVFNFQVDDFHTYYVAAETGNDVLLVHNANCQTFEVVDIRSVMSNSQRPFADAKQLKEMGKFSFVEYGRKGLPQVRRKKNGILTIQDGTHRIEKALREGIFDLPVEIIP